MKRLLPYLVLIAALALILAFVSCGKTSSNEEKVSIQIATTSFPQYDWLREITKGVEGVELVLLNKNGTDLHSYQPSIEDIRKIGSSTLFVFTGGESEEWAQDAVKALGKSEESVFSMLNELGERALEEEIVEGMESNHEEPEGSEDEIEMDEHVWLSLKNAVSLVSSLAKRLSELDSANSQAYISNAKAYIEKLSALDKQYTETVKTSVLDTIIVADRFPFLYMVKDYSINYYAAFSGCSAETEASFNTIIFLAEKTESLGTDSILILEKSDERLAKTIIENTELKSVKTLVLNSLQSVSEADINSGLTYIYVMEENLETLKEALN